MSPRQMVDLDAYRDANAILHRNVVREDIPKVEWETPYLSDNELRELFGIIDAATTNAQERKVTATFYDTRKGIYRTHEFYEPDIEFSVYKADENEIVYNPIRIALVGY